MDEIVRNLAANPYAQAFAIVAALVTVIPGLWKASRWVFRFGKTLVIDGIRASVVRYFGTVARAAAKDYKDVRLIVTRLYIIIINIFLELIAISFFILFITFAPLTVNDQGSLFRTTMLVPTFVLAAQVVFNAIVSMRYSRHVRRLIVKRARRVSQ